MEKHNYELKKGQINLIVSPVSSGKTYYIFEELLRDKNLARVIYLCDTSSLKQAVRSDGIYYDRTKYYEATDIRKLGKKLAFYTDGMLIDESG